MTLRCGSNHIYEPEVFTHECGQLVHRPDHTCKAFSSLDQPHAVLLARCRPAATLAPFRLDFNVHADVTTNVLGLNDDGNTRDEVQRLAPVADLHWHERARADGLEIGLHVVFDFTFGGSHRST